MLRKLLLGLPTLGRFRKGSILIGYDLLAMCFALWAAFSARLGVFYVPQSSRVFVSAAVSFAVGLVVLYRLGIYDIVLRYFDLRNIMGLLSAAAVTAVTWVLVVYLTNPMITIDGLTFDVPRSVAFIFFGFFFLLLLMGRHTMKLLVVGAHRGGRAPAGKARKIIIYGANPAGISLADSVGLSPRYQLIGFVDADPAAHGRMAAGIQIHSPDALARLAASGEVEEVFLAMPDATRSQRLKAISQLRGLNVEVKTVPAPEEIVSGRFTVSDIRPIDVSDLLRRDSVEPLGALIRDAVEDHSILVTGAGGSIGSEICRQVIQGRPSKLVLLDHSEFALYSINENLAEIAEQLPRGGCEVVPVIGSMLNDRTIRHVLDKYNIDTIYHAAAYKHVPLLEDNEVVGTENNVFGTQVVARAAFDAKITRFTMISTDKAVRPKSVMGASKRVAELIIQALANDEHCCTQFGIVRFGNVLDSSGSVVHRFRKQIRAGGPVTVTHPEITRFFMSIPEATQLVLQASAMARAGEVFVLDMGGPVKIADLARHMIDLSGMSVRDEQNPDGEIEITYVGLRPGEKLFEELFIGEDTVATLHPRIRMAKERILSLSELEPMLDELCLALQSSDRARIRTALANFIAAEQERGPIAGINPNLIGSGTDG
jgi:UDP-N-acetylglucosamine 4,6-dehydratase